MVPNDECSRRLFLGAGVAAMTGVAGCLGGGEARVDGQHPVETTTEVTDAALFVEDGCEPNTGPVSGDALTVDFDSRRLLGCQGLLFDDFERIDRWQTYDGAMAAETTAQDDGTQSVRLTASDAERRAWIYRTFDDGIDLSEWDLSLAVHSGRGATRVDQFRLQVLAPDRHNRIDMWYPVTGVRGWVRLDFGPTQEVGAPDLTDVREIRLQTWVGESDAGTCHVDELRVTPKLSEGGVVLTFDDISLSQYENAFPVMQEYGYAGVAGAIPWLSEDDDRISVAQLTEMQAAGWDIVSHPQVERPLPAYAAAGQERLLRKTKRWLVENGFASGARFIIFPFGQADETTLNLAARYHYLGFLGGRCPHGLITGPLTVGRVNGDDVSTTDYVLQSAKRHRQIAVVMFHTVGAGGNRISTEEFRKTITRIDELGLRVLTAADLWELQPAT